MQHRLFRARRRIALQRRVASIAIASMFGIAGAAQAFEIEVGNPDLAMRWDNTFRYNLGMRTQNQDEGARACSPPRS
jgi:hypothetical protein